VGVELFSKRPVLIPSVASPTGVLSRRLIEGPRLGLNLGLVIFPVSAVQLSSLFSTPLPILGAPYNTEIFSQVILVNWVLVKFVYPSSGGVQYTGGGPLTFQYHGTGTLVHGGSGIANTVFQAAASSLTLLPPISANSVLSSVQGLGVDMTVASANFAAGNGTATVTVSYAILTLQ
jgi:hypothetical protein